MVSASRKFLGKFVKKIGEISSQPSGNTVWTAIG